MVLSGSHHVPDVNNIMGGMEHTASGVRMHNHRRKLRQRFDLVRKLGQGTYGKVQLGINKETGQEVAIKTIKKAKIETEADLIRIRREIQIMSSVQHPNIIHIYEVFENKEKMVLVMEYAAGGELYDYLSERKVLSETEARRIFRQVASAVYYCHKHKICHRDLKLENILLDESKSAKIADFGLSNVFDERRLLTTFCGSPLYASPEIVRGTPYHGPEVDCWSLGVLLYTLVYGAMPFDGSNFKRLVKQISSGDYYEPPKPSSASPLIRHMLLVDPSKRASVEDICSHWWVNETYGESCLEVAEDLANQTPVRLDLLLTLLPAGANGDAVVVGNKMDTSISCVPIGQETEGDSMNEYYSSNSNAANKTSEREPTSTGAKEASTKSSKKKREHDKEKDGAKRKRDEPDAIKSSACGAPLEGAPKKPGSTTANNECSDVLDGQPQGSRNVPSPTAVATAKEMDTVCPTAESSIPLAPPSCTALTTRPPSMPSVVDDSSRPLVTTEKETVSEADLISSAATAAATASDIGASTPAAASPALAPPGGEQVSDTRRVYESKPENKPMIVPALKVSDAKKAFETAAAAAKPAAPPSQSTLPRRTLIQTPPNTATTNDRSLGKEVSRLNQPQRNSIAVEECDKNSTAAAYHPGEKVVVGGLGVKIGAIGKVTEIGMQVKTEDSETSLSHKSGRSTTPSPRSAEEAEAKSGAVLKSPSDKLEAATNDVSNVSMESDTADTSVKATSISTAPVIRSPELVNAASALIGTKAPSPPLAGGAAITKRNSPVPTLLPLTGASVASATPTQQVIGNDGIHVTLDPVGPERKVASMLVSGSPAFSHQSRPTHSSSPPAHSPIPEIPKTPIDTNKSHQSKAPAQEEVARPTSPRQPHPQLQSLPQNQSQPSFSAASAAKALPKSNQSPPVSPSKLASPPPGKLVSIPSSSVPGRVKSPPPGPVKTGPPVPPKRIVSSPPPPQLPSSSAPNKVNPADICMGSENAFLRNIRSPTRDTQTAKRFSKGPVENNAEITITLPAPPTLSPQSPTAAAAPSGKSSVAPAAVRAPAANARVAEQMPLTSKSQSGDEMIKNHDTKPQLQKTEIVFPVSTSSASIGPKERIIPIQIEGRQISEDKSSAVTTPQSVAKPSPPILSTTNSSASVAPLAPAIVRASSSLGKPSSITSRQESVQSPVSSLDSQRLREPIRKSPREFIIPISVEGGGYVTPKEDASSSVPSRPSSLSHTSASATPTTANHKHKTGRLDRTKRYGGLFPDNMPAGENSRNGALGEGSGPSSPLHAQPNHLQRLSSFGRGYGSDTREDEPSGIVHEIRRSGSGSSCDDDDDDDDTFQILTAESLFSTLLSRVRQLTRRSNRDSADPFVVFRNSRYSSPAPPNAGHRSGENGGTSSRQGAESSEAPDNGPPSTCTSPTNSASLNHHRNSIGSDIGSKGFWSNLYTKNPSTGTSAEGDARRFSTIDPSRHYISQRDEQLQAAANPSSSTRHRSMSRDLSDSENISITSNVARDVTVHTSSTVYSASVSSPPPTPTARMTLSLHVSVPTSPEPTATAAAAAAVDCHTNPDPEGTFQLHYVTTRTSYIGSYSPL